MAVLVTGGAGYIGSHTVAGLVERDEDVIVVDSLEKGHRKALSGGRLITGDLRDTGFLRHLFNENAIGEVIHFAAYIEAGESVSDPIRYYNNNVISTLNLLTVMIESGVKKMVFSSTAAVYGEPQSIPICENDRTLPINPYGETKLAVEKALKWADAAYGIKHMILRYFNAAGAHENARMGEDHKPETHLIPLVLQAAAGKREAIKLFGSDYETFDGTCIRDYIHVSDLAAAHILALERLRRNGDSDVFNLGNGQGFSNRQVINTVQKVTGKTVKVVESPRRPGDPPVLVASSVKAADILGWKPVYTRLEDIIDTAWNWHKNNPDGFGPHFKSF